MPGIPCIHCKKRKAYWPSILHSSPSWLMPPRIRKLPSILLWSIPNHISFYPDQIFLLSDCDLPHPGSSLESSVGDPIVGQLFLCPTSGETFSDVKKNLDDSMQLKWKPRWEGFTVTGSRVESVTAAADMNPALMINSPDEIPSNTRLQSCFVWHRHWLVVERFAVEQLPRTIPGDLFLTKYIVRFQSLRQIWWMARVMLGTGRRIANVDSIFHGKKMTFQGGFSRSLNRSQS